MLYANIQVETCYGATTRNRRAGGPFSRAAWWTAITLIALYAIAAGHELIPELCTDPMRAGDDCGLCHLVHTLALTATAAMALLCLNVLAYRPLITKCPGIPQPLWAGYALRAPPPFVMHQ